MTFKQAEYGLKQLEEATVLEVTQLCMSLEQEKETIESQEKNIKKAEEALDIARERYSRGLISNLEYMGAQVSLTHAKTNYFQAITNYNTAKAGLERITGKKLK